MNAHRWPLNRHRFRAAVATGGVVAGLLATGGVAQAATADGTPCDIGVRACVDLDEEKAWLLTPSGEIEHGPEDISQGDEDSPTPVGTFTVQWKHKDHWSTEYDSPMPYSVFFAPGGIAFHEGDLDGTSGGCVRLEEDEAEIFFETLQVGDRVQVRK